VIIFSLAALTLYLHVPRPKAYSLSHFDIFNDDSYISEKKHHQNVNTVIWEGL